MSDENILRLIEILKDYGYFPKMLVELMDFADPAKRHEWIDEKNMRAFNLEAEETAQPDVDILVEGVSYEELKIVSYESGSIEFPVASIQDLIEMKENAGRDVDQLDIKYLKRLKEEKNNE